jgi:uncharacterized membrane protein YidH (DUF202 family)
VTADPLDDDLDDQYERTLLSWRRTALSLVAAGVLVAHLSVRSLGPAALVVSLTGIAAVIGFVWLSHGRLVGAAGFGLVLGVLLLGAMALAGVARP